jgi:hypothetical protein
MTYKEFVGKYVGKKAHFDKNLEGQYLLDFTGASFSNVVVKGAHEEFYALFDEVEKVYVLVPYVRTVIRVSKPEGHE